jgi:tRNA-dihydrouridine synthase B
VARILHAVSQAVAVPVTLKIRTGPNPQRRNAVRVARIAESAGIQALAVHGRTRACAFGGEAEYDTIAEVKSAVRIPVIANGDIRTPEEAKRVLSRTGADGIMIGRAAQGRPWLFREIAALLERGEHIPAATPAEMAAVLAEHLLGLYELYGAEHGARIARKHIGWTVRELPGGELFRREANLMIDPEAQLRAVGAYFRALAADETPYFLEKQAA